jgi:hypothetical protein
MMDGLKMSDDEKRKAVDFAVKNIGNRLFHLHVLAEDVKDLKCSSLKECQ